MPIAKWKCEYCGELCDSEALARGCEWKHKRENSIADIKDRFGELVLDLIRASQDYYEANKFEALGDYDAGLAEVFAKVLEESKVAVSD